MKEFLKWIDGNGGIVITLVEVAVGLFAIISACKYAL